MAAGRRPRQFGLCLAAQGARRKTRRRHHQFHPVYRESYAIPLPVKGRWKEILNSDAEIYGGSGKGNGGAVFAEKNSTGAIMANITLPPLATLMLEQE